MAFRYINAEAAPAPAGTYSQAVETLENPGVISGA